MIDAHPALKAVSPQAPLIDFFDGDDCRHNGAFLLAHNFRFFGMFPKLNPKMYDQKDSRDPDYGTPDGYKFFLDLGPLANVGQVPHNAEPFWNDQMAHGDYDDFCQARNLRPHIKAIKPAVLTVGGWYDAEDLAGTFYCYNRVAETSPECPQNVLVMGPWVHGGWARGDGDALGPVKFNAKTAAYYREKVELPFFEHHLKGGRRPTAAEGGADVRDGHEPLAAVRHLAAGGGEEGDVLVRGRPGARRPGSRRPGTRFDEYVSRPGEAGAVRREDVAADGERLHDGRPAVRRRGGRTCWCTRRRCWPRTLYVAGRSRSSCT